MHDRLWSLDGSGIHSVGCTASAFARLQTTLQEQRPDAVVRAIDGATSRTQTDFFTTIAAALEFPSYFGYNWYAFNDLMLDLGWIRGSAFVLLFPNAHLLMDQAEPASLGSLAYYMRTLHDEWQMTGMPVGNVQPVPFHAVFQAPPEHLAALNERLTAAGFALDPAWPPSEQLD